MTKVDIRRLDSVTKNDTTATAQINDNFTALQEAIENTLSRDGTGPNYMDADLDMNSYRIINSSDPVEDNDIVNLRYVEERIGGAVAASNTAVSAASQAASSAQSALVSSTNAINTLRNAEEQLSNVVAYVEESIQTIDNTIEEAVEDVKAEAVAAAEEVIDDVESDLRTGLQPLVTEAGDYASLSRTWATGTDAEVHEIEPDEHSSRGYADLAMAIANTPEDVPVDISTLLALDVIRGPKGDKGDSWAGGEVTTPLVLVSDDNHPIAIRGMAGASATGYQIIDSNGLGESDFEHYATGDRYGTRITNKNNTSETTSNIDFYQSNAGRSVLDLSEVQTILAPALLGAMYPVGSYYLSESAECPLAELITNSQWEIVGTSLVSGATASVAGNGMTIGLIDSANINFGMGLESGYGLTGYQNYYGTPSTNNVAGQGNATAGAAGLTTDPTKSGIVANLPAITVNIFRRTI